MSPPFTRRQALIGGGALLVRFSLGDAAVLARSTPPGSAEPAAHGSVEIGGWLRIDADGNVTVFTGKVELGQGIETALAQIAAEALDLALERVTVITADTERTPNEGYTAGSRSVEQSGSAIRRAAEEARQVLLELAAERLGVEPSGLTLADGSVQLQRAGSTDAPAAESYGSLVAGRTIERTAPRRSKPPLRRSGRWVGQPVPRTDLPAKVFGEGAFVHDLRLPGMLHGRVVRPPTYGARLAGLELPSDLERRDGVTVVRDGSFLGVVAPREEQAIEAARRLARAAAWTEPPSADAGETSRLPAGESPAAYLRRSSTRSAVGRESPGPAPEAVAHRLERTYSKPWIAHASIGPSCAVALHEDQKTTVWCHSQGVFQLRQALARTLGMPRERLHLIHVDGSGCYGHNGADDVACDAALLARAAPKRPVRVQWSRADEMRWEPYGSAMAFRLEGAVDTAGRIVEWQHEIWSCLHSTRPGARPTLLAGWHLADSLPPLDLSGVRPPTGGAVRNADPIYAFPYRVVQHLVPSMPLRVSALRGLGAYGNVFALESFLDELAEAAGVDPLAMRLRHLTDPRARAVLELLARKAGWAGRARGLGTDDGRARGRGWAFARYKNSAAYLAVVAAVAVDRTKGEVAIERLEAAVDAGQIVNPDGLRNQIEGGLVQATSWTLFEAVSFDAEGILSRDWRSYPILRFSQCPAIEVHLLDRPEQPPLGAGEAAQGPTAAAIANAVADATGARLRDLPLSADRVRETLTSTAAESG